MNPFDYARPGADQVDPAALGLSATARPLAGGTDLLPLVKLGREQPEQLVDLKTSGLDGRIERTGDGWRLGALATLRALQSHDGLRADATALPEAAELAATAQLRNRATVAGNLLQRPRCWYFRHEHVRCWLAGGDHCPAREGRNEHHAIVEQSPCVAVHPSDPPAALIALDATVTVRGSDGERTLPVADLLVPPTDEHRIEHLLGDDEVITALTIPRHANVRSTYVKAMDRAVWAFALVGVAAALRLDGDGSVVTASIVANGVANVPHRLTAVEAALHGRPVDDARFLDAADAATEGTAPLSHNGYKLPLLRQLTRRALERLAAVP